MVKHLYTGSCVLELGTLAVREVWDGAYPAYQCMTRF